MRAQAIKVPEQHVSAVMGADRSEITYYEANEVEFTRATPGDGTHNCSNLTGIPPGAHDSDSHSHFWKSLRHQFLGRGLTCSSGIFSFSNETTDICTF